MTSAEWPSQVDVRRPSKGVTSCSRVSAFRVLSASPYIHENSQLEHANLVHAPLGQCRDPSSTLCATDGRKSLSIAPADGLSCGELAESTPKRRQPMVELREPVKCGSGENLACSLQRNFSVRLRNCDRAKVRFFPRSQIFGRTSERHTQALRCRVRSCDPLSTLTETASHGPAWTLSCRQIFESTARWLTCLPSVFCPHLHRSPLCNTRASPTTTVSDCTSRYSACPLCPLPRRVADELPEQ